MSTTPAERARVGVHANSASITIVRTYAGHQLVHLRQLMRIAAVAPAGTMVGRTIAATVLWLVPLLALATPEEAVPLSAVRAQPRLPAAWRSPAELRPGVARTRDRHRRRAGLAVATPPPGSNR